MLDQSHDRLVPAWNVGLDTAKISYGSRPFTLHPPPFSIVAAHVFGVLAVILAAWVLLAAFCAAVFYGLAQFLFLAGIAAFLAFVGVLTCVYAWRGKFAHETLQIVAYQGKRG